MTSRVVPESDWPTLLEYLLHRVFGAALTCEPTIIETVRRFDDGVELDDDGDLTFTLPGLYRLLMQECGRRTSESDFRAFRRALYASGINAELRRLGAIVIVAQATDDPAKRRYRLQRLRS